MIKFFAALAILTVMISMASVYNLKQETYDLEETKRTISAQILKDRQAIKVLKAEMAYLSRPERLERLSRRHLVLDATQNEQLVSTLGELSIRENVMVANLPVDNFQMLLPRQKPNPVQIAKRNAKIRPSPNVRMASFDSVENQTKVEKINKADQRSLYERILAKIGN
ncbi:MAG: hypothetical protein HOH19_02245 [Kordiimonadaceae bacterium]|jgi:cell division protein FtsL|nr:hypothetical protein [Kordiimonadaceae bacterium]MBT6031369.1 hypothetical protein [Kordiimonadaceae bacterium]